MEGADPAGLAAAIVAVAALVVAVAAFAMARRSDGGSADVPASSARLAEVERRVVQSARRLEALESEVDAQRSGGSESGSPARGVRQAREEGQAGAVSRIGLVRFDAFADTGGAQSFALALIDETGHGVVLTSLHSRQTTRLYVKDIRAGVADTPLSSEEMRALREAGIPT